MYYSIAYMENDRVYSVLAQGDSMQDVSALFKARNVDSGRILLDIWERSEFVPVDASQAEG